MTRSRTVINALCLVSVLALGACSGEDPHPKIADPAPTLPSSPSTTAVSGPVEPTMPAAARGTDAAAAEAFVRFYWEMVNYAQATGDVEGLTSLGRRCGACDNGVESITETYNDHGTIRGGEASVGAFDTNFLLRDGPDWAVVECQLVTEKELIDLPGRAQDSHYPGGNTDIRMILEPDSGSWLVRSMATR